MRLAHVAHCLALVSLTTAIVSNGLTQPLGLSSKSTLPSRTYHAEFASTQNAPDQCPPCFNCLLPAFHCKQYAHCNDFKGACDCPAGFGGDDCIEPLCGSLAEGKNRRIREGKTCECSNGWSGLNCNVCQTDAACGALMPEGLNGTCYKGGLVVHENFQMCDVTNRKILDQLKTKKPQVTFSCNEAAQTCNFQFWVDQTESFYCGLDTCKFSQKVTYAENSTTYNCENISCECIPGRMLCGEEGSIDISDFLSEEIKGPGSFTCSSTEGTCRFEEPAMNDLISDVFGDRSITLNCDSSECLHMSEVPGYTRPRKKVQSGLIAGSISGALLILLILAGSLWAIARRSRKSLSVGEIHLADDESGQLMTNHSPADLQFSDVFYYVNGKKILSGVLGHVRHGQMMAIMGASGAGKTSLLDMIARKSKSGKASGDFLVNGAVVSDTVYREVVGFVDQEDVLIPTLTVYETVLYSALLRLPRDMSFSSKRLRVMETLSELGILHIKDSLIGQEGKRGISGGEKRRVSIACELVTSPSILVLDEPTSGLDSFNAYNVVDCLRKLARNYNRTVIMTIHQPRSNIVSMFDQLILLASGKTVYSGPLAECQSYLENIGLGCPPGYNIADYLLDLTMSDDSDEEIADSTPPTGHGSASHLERCDSINDDAAEAWGAATPKSVPVAPSHHRDRDTARDVEHLARMFQGSQVYSNIISAIQTNKDVATDHAGELKRPLGVGHKRITWLAQFTLLAERTFKNLYRDPTLLLTHYGIAIILALLSGYLFFGISNDLPGFQGRLGLFFFVLALFGFSTLTSLNVFATERNVFMRERANGYYAPITYFFAKVVFDILPLRILPPIIMGIVIYPMVGLVPEIAVFGKFILILVLFNLAASAVCLLIGILIRDVSVANLVGSLFMLFSLLFAGLLLNHDKIPYGLQWIQRLSIFHYAYEALLVNEVTYLTLTEKKFGLSIDVPGATILSTFGFNAQALWSDILGLTIYFAVFLCLSYIAMQVLLVERR